MARELGGNDSNSYMGFAGSGHVRLMARMKVAFIDDGKALGREGVGELPLNAGLQCRFHIPASTSLAKKGSHKAYNIPVCQFLLWGIQGPIIRTP